MRSYPNGILQYGWYGTRIVSPISRLSDGVNHLVIFHWNSWVTSLSEWAMRNFFQSIEYGVKTFRCSHSWGSTRRKSWKLWKSIHRVSQIERIDSSRILPRGEYDRFVYIASILCCAINHCTISSGFPEYTVSLPPYFWSSVSIDSRASRTNPNRASSTQNSSIARVSWIKIGNISLEFFMASMSPVLSWSLRSWRKMKRERLFRGEYLREKVWENNKKSLSNQGFYL